MKIGRVNHVLEVMLGMEEYRDHCSGICEKIATDSIQKVTPG